MPGGITEGHRELCAQRFSKSHSHTSQTTNQDSQQRQEELHGLREQEGERRVGNARPSGSCCVASCTAFLPWAGPPSLECPGSQAEAFDPSGVSCAGWFGGVGERLAKTATLAPQPRVPPTGLGQVIRLTLVLRIFLSGFCLF